MSGSEFADEGEEASGGAVGVPLEPAQPADFESSVTQFSLRGRAKRAWQIIRGKDVEKLTADPDRAIRQARAHQENRWRGIYALVLLLAMVAQVGVTDLLFWVFLKENDWQVEAPIFIAFFSSTVVEVIGLVLVITRSLFPNTDKPSASPDSV